MVATTIDRSRVTPANFYVWMGLVCVVIAFGGFAPTYWLQLAPGTFAGPPLLHLHALVFSAWPVLFVTQAWLAARGRLGHHRAWGGFAIALATAMVLVGIATAVVAMEGRLDAGYGDRARAFLIVPLSAIGAFAVLFVAAIACVRHTEWHRRLLLLATIAVLKPAVARVFLLLHAAGGPGVRPGLGPPLPVINSVVVGLVVDLLVVVAIAWDWRTRGRPHPAYLYGGAFLLLNEALRVPIAGTSAWLQFAESLRHFSG